MQLICAFIQEAEMVEWSQTLDDALDWYEQ